MQPCPLQHQPNDRMHPSAEVLHIYPSVRLPEEIMGQGGPGPTLHWMLSALANSCRPQHSTALSTCSDCCCLMGKASTARAASALCGVGPPATAPQLPTLCAHLETAMPATELAFRRNRISRLTTMRSSASQSLCQSPQ
jgi:hypothetical protein